MKADDIRRVYLDYMAETGHVIIPRAPLIPHDDPTTLFTGSGMQPLLPYLLGAEHPAGRRLADSQTCLRAQDIDEAAADELLEMGRAARVNDHRSSDDGDPPA